MMSIDNLAPVASASYMVSEENMNEQADYYKEAFADSEEVSPEDIYWLYVDDAETATEEANDGDMNDDGTANYTIIVTDKSGNGLENATVQVCTTETCTVHKTDADGKVTFTSDPYAYEVYILKAMQSLPIPTSFRQTAAA